MNKLLRLATTAVAAVLSTSVLALPDRIGDFGLLDSDGDFHQLSRYRNKEALVLMSFDPSCASIGTSL
ncbi:MAG: peroxiredoxin, partial [Proteobacteria bacterium]|nr:peroxiredoxin [Pseudomonadota bacterium]